MERLCFAKPMAVRVQQFTCSSRSANATAQTSFEPTREMESSLCVRHIATHMQFDRPPKRGFRYPCLTPLRARGRRSLIVRESAGCDFDAGVKRDGLLAIEADSGDGGIEVNA